MSGDSAERSETYGWARRHGLYEPYDFAIQYDHLWGGMEDVIEAARRWQRRHLTERKKRLEGELAELRRRIEIVDAHLERNETEEFGS